jgi:hypothetical protein
VDPKTGLDEVEKRKFLTLPGPELPSLGPPARSQSPYRLAHDYIELVILMFSVSELYYRSVKDLERSGHGIFLGFMKTTKNMRQDSQCPSQDSSGAPLKYESGWYCVNETEAEVADS